MANSKFVGRSIGGDSRVRSLLQDVVRRIDPELLDGIDGNEERAVLALIRTSFRQAIHLIEKPARAPGWNYKNPVILETLKKYSKEQAFRRFGGIHITLDISANVNIYRHMRDLTALGQAIVDPTRVRIIAALYSFAKSALPTQRSVANWPGHQQTSAP
jgi:hypothetical protein